MDSIVNNGQIGSNLLVRTDPSSLAVICPESMPGAKITTEVSDVFVLILGRSIKWNARFTLFSPRVSQDESEFTHRPAGGVSRERQYVLPDKQHRLRHRTEFPIFGCTTRAILESTSLDIW